MSPATETAPERGASRRRVAAFVGVTLVAVLGAGGYGLAQRQEHVARSQRPPAVEHTSTGAFDHTPRIVFRHTGLDSSYGLVATVSLARPSGARDFTDVACDRVAAWAGGASCLAVERGVATRFEAREYDAAWNRTATHPLPGAPSRTRVSSDGRLVATTSFVTGHSYMSTGFSTETVVREFSGPGHWDNLEEFTLVVEGEQVAPVDRNVWGVTFAEDRRFYATVSTGGTEWLVEGDLGERTLTTLADGAECPSLSPDGTRLAFKVDLDPGRKKVWGLAVHDLASGRRTVLSDATRGVDDQVSWLDDDTLLYAMPRPAEPGVSDVWALDTAPGAVPRVLVEQASSPTVVR